MSEIDKMRYERERQTQMNGASLPAGMSEELMAAQEMQMAVANQHFNNTAQMIVGPQASMIAGNAGYGYFQMQRQVTMLTNQLKIIDQ